MTRRKEIICNIAVKIKKTKVRQGNCGSSFPPRGEGDASNTKQRGRRRLAEFVRVADLLAVDVTHREQACERPTIDFRGVISAAVDRYQRRITSFRFNSIYTRRLNSLSSLSIFISIWDGNRDWIREERSDCERVSKGTESKSNGDVIGFWAKKWFNDEWSWGRRLRSCLGPRCSCDFDVGLLKKLHIIEKKNTLPFCAKVFLLIVVQSL